MTDASTQEQTGQALSGELPTLKTSTPQEMASLWQKEWQKLIGKPNIYNPVEEKGRLRYFPLRRELGQYSPQGWLLSKSGVPNKWLTGIPEHLSYRDYSIQDEKYIRQSDEAREKSRVQQYQADNLTARSLGITYAQALLLREVTTDKLDFGGKKEEAKGAQKQAFVDALINPEKLLGENATLLFAFARQLEKYNQQDWKNIAQTLRDNRHEFSRSSTDFFTSLGTDVYHDTRRQKELAEYCLSKEVYDLYAKANNLNPLSTIHDQNLSMIDSGIQVAINEIRHAGKLQGDVGTVVLPLFPNSEGEPLNTNWLKEHPQEK